MSACEGVWECLGGLWVCVRECDCVGVCGRAALHVGGACRLSQSYPLICQAMATSLWSCLPKTWGSP